VANILSLCYNANAERLAATFVHALASCVLVFVHRNERTRSYLIDMQCPFVKKETVCTSAHGQRAILSNKHIPISMMIVLCVKSRWTSLRVSYLGTFGRWRKTVITISATLVIQSPALTGLAKAIPQSMLSI